MVCVCKLHHDEKTDSNRYEVSHDNGAITYTSDSSESDMECFESSNSSDSDNDYEELRDSMDLITEFIESEDSSLDDGSDLSDSNTVHDNHIEENTENLEQSIMKDYGLTN